jgi:hypothetical protein
MLKATGIDNRKAISEIISYVLLIAIALGISVAVYTWMSTRVPIVSETCPEDISLQVKSYSCDKSDTERKLLDINLKNNGNFNVDGFYIRTSNNLSTIPTLLGLECGDCGSESTNAEMFLSQGGRFNFRYILGDLPLAPGKDVLVEFKYKDVIKKIQIEPFIESKNSLQICTDATINIEVDNLIKHCD